MIFSIFSLILMQIAAMVGMYWGNRLPASHLDANGRDAAKLAAGLVTTLAALVMGLLIKSAAGTFSMANTGFAEMSAKIIILDGALAEFGDESKPLRSLIHTSVKTLHENLWPSASTPPQIQASPAKYLVESRLENIHEETRWDTISTQVRGLSAETQSLKLLRDEAQQLSGELVQLRMVLLQKAYAGFPDAVLIILLIWCALLFTMLGVLTPNNATVKVMIFAGAFSVAGGFFLILEMSHPLDGLIKISGQPFERALQVIAR